ncbi:unnamed protein product, partial [Urochloa humidicola]
MLLAVVVATSRLAPPWQLPVRMPGGRNIIPRVLGELHRQQPLRQQPRRAPLYATPHGIREHVRLVPQRQRRHGVGAADCDAARCHDFLGAAAAADPAALSTVPI